jgi:hypothetical protein
VLHALTPRVAQIAMNTSFRMFPDSSAAKGDKGAKPQLSAGGDGPAADDAGDPLLKRAANARFGSSRCRRGKSASFRTP